MPRRKPEQIKTYNKDITEREKAVIIWALVTGCQDWQKIYLLSRPNDPSTYSTKNLATACSKWKHSARIERFTEEQRAALEARERAIIQAHAGTDESDPETETETDGETKTENSQSKKRNTAKIDFTDTARALEELNRLANDIQDPIKRADAIQAIQKLKAQTATEEDTGPEIQRFYTPLRCQSCQLYKNAQPQPEK